MVRGSIHTKTSRLHKKTWWTVQEAPTRHGDSPGSCYSTAVDNTVYRQYTDRKAVAGAHIAPHALANAVCSWWLQCDKTVCNSFRNTLHNLSLIAVSVFIFHKPSHIPYCILPAPPTVCKPLQLCIPHPLCVCPTHCV